MASAFQIMLDQQPADPDLMTLLVSLEVEESLDLPAAMQIVLPIARDAGGDLNQLAESRLAPMANVAVIAGIGDTGNQCIFDGYVLTHKLHLETGITNSTVSVWGQDSSWL